MGVSRAAASHRAREGQPSRTQGEERCLELRDWAHGCDKSEESRFLTQATNKWKLLVIEMEKTGGRMSLVVVER